MTCWMFSKLLTLNCKPFRLPSCLSFCYFIVIVLAFCFCFFFFYFSVWLILCCYKTASKEEIPSPCILYRNLEKEKKKGQFILWILLAVVNCGFLCIPFPALYTCTLEDMWIKNNLSVLTACHGYKPKNIQLEILVSNIGKYQLRIK